MSADAVPEDGRKADGKQGRITRFTVPAASAP